MENVKNRFDTLLNQVNKIASLKLESNEGAVMSGMLNSGIGASANDAINRLSTALNTKETNNFTVVQEKESFLGPNFSAKDFNYLNKDIEAILQSGYNAKVIDQNLGIANMLNGKPNNKEKGETVLNITDYMNMKSKNQTTTYSDFDAKYNTIIEFIGLTEDNSVRLTPQNNLYLYNTVINLLNEIDKKNINTNLGNVRENLTALRQVKNINLQNYLSKLTTNDFTKIENGISGKRLTLDEARKRLENQIFNKVDPKFDMKTCHDKFARAVENTQNDMQISSF